MKVLSMLGALALFVSTDSWAVKLPGHEDLTSAIADAASSITQAIEANTIAVYHSETGLCTDGVNSKTGEICGEWAGATLKKLAPWGQQLIDVASPYYFEWPTAESLNEMNPNTSLQSIDFLEAYGTFASV